MDKILLIMPAYNEEANILKTYKTIINYCKRKKLKYDVIVIGLGPSSIFLAYELIKLKKYKKVLLIEQGKRVENRNCPLEEIGKCIKCKPFCNITSGFSGAGAFSDGKLSLYDPEDNEIHVGGNIQEYLGVEETKKLIDFRASN